MPSPADMPRFGFHGAGTADLPDPQDVDARRLRRIIGQVHEVYDAVSEFAADEDVAELTKYICDRFDEGVRL